MKPKMKDLENRFLFRMVFVVSVHICYILLSNNYEGFWYGGCWNGWCYCFIPTIRDSCRPGSCRPDSCYPDFCRPDSRCLDSCDPGSCSRMELNATVQGTQPAGPLD